MCYTVYLSTDSDEDLSHENSELLQFDKRALDEPITALLEYENRWYVASRSGCSCSFRHLLSVALGFSAPVYWYEEDDDDIAATLSFIKIVRRMIDGGNHVDCIDAWYGAAKEDILEETVNLDEIADDKFRFFENHRFVFVTGE